MWVTKAFHIATTLLPPTYYEKLTGKWNLDAKILTSRTSQHDRISSKNPVHFGYHTFKAKRLAKEQALLSCSNYRLLFHRLLLSSVKWGQKNPTW